jgi:hypothetical protein
MLARNVLAFHKSDILYGGLGPTAGFRSAPLPTFADNAAATSVVRLPTEAVFCHCLLSGNIVWLF